MKASKRHWFHCSEVPHGKRWVAARICPRIVAPSEPRTPRLCVAESVVQCFAARLFAGVRDVYVYRTTGPRSGIKPVGVWDATITQERWIIPPVELELRAVIPADTAERASARTLETLMSLIDGNGRKSLTTAERVMAYADALDVLPAFASEFDRRFVPKLVTMFDPAPDASRTAGGSAS